MLTHKSWKGLLKLTSFPIFSDRCNSGNYVTFLSFSLIGTQDISSKMEVFITFCICTVIRLELKVESIGIRISVGYFPFEICCLASACFEVP